MGEEMKWLAAMVASIAITMGSCASIDIIAKAQVEIAQMECGKEKENGK